jgi:hypothetical protein
MRMMLRISKPAEGGNRAIRDGLLPKLVQQTVELIKPEGAYFTVDKGVRTAYYFFDMKDSSMMPQIGEPWFAGTGAAIDLQPVMTGDELKAGLEKALGK